MLPFVGKLLSSTLPWSCLFFNFTKFVIIENLSILDLALSGVKELNFYVAPVLSFPIFYCRILNACILLGVNRNSLTFHHDACILIASLLDNY